MRRRARERSAAGSSSFFPTKLLCFSQVLAQLSVCSAEALKAPVSHLVFPVFFFFLMPALQWSSPALSITHDGLEMFSLDKHNHI